MIIGKHRNSKAIIDLGAIKENIRRERARMAADQSLFAVVKANAYGYGLLPVAQAAVEAGVDGFCVAVIDEGVALRNAGITKTILVLGVTSANTAVYSAMHDLSVTVADTAFLTAAQPLLAQEHRRLKVHLALDSGMGRIGFTSSDELQSALQFITAHPQEFDLEGTFTHFATADDPDPAYYEQQMARFKELMAPVTAKPRFVHVANSAAALWHKECGGNAIRLGVAMYGMNPAGTAQAMPAGFHSALTLESELVFVKQINPGDSVGYGKTYTAQKPEWIGTVPMGYADGWLRRMQGSQVLVDGHFCEIVGRVCMDQFMIRLPHAYPQGTRVTLIGENNGSVITPQDVADYAHTINYEITCCLSDRIKREYRE